MKLLVHSRKRGSTGGKKTCRTFSFEKFPIQARIMSHVSSFASPFLP
jgi:hypothetical protein